MMKAYPTSDQGILYESARMIVNQDFPNCGMPTVICTSFDLYNPVKERDRLDRAFLRGDSLHETERMDFRCFNCDRSGAYGNA